MLVAFMAKKSDPHQTDDSDTSVSLIERLREHPEDQDAWVRFVDRYGPQILGWCRAWGIQDADARDLTQIVLSRLLTKIERFKYDPSKSFRGWLHQVTRRAWAESIRKKWPVVPGGDSRFALLVEGQEAREDLVQRIEKEFDLELREEAERRVLNRVKPQTWEAYHLTAVEGLSGIEVSKRLRMSVTNVFAAKRNVLAMLQEEVKTLERRQMYR
jgi:RNA polymerase sigma-70 factor (ECF subfamily)